MKFMCTRLKANHKIVIYYVIFGPIIGACTVAALSTAFIVLPDIFRDPENMYGHSRGSEYVGLIGLILIFSYPVGVVPALVSGVVHSKIRHRFASNRIGYTCLVAAVGASVAGLELVFLPFDSYLLMVPAFCSAMLLAFRLSMQVDTIR